MTHEITCPHCGSCFDHKPKADRSLPQLRRFHALVRAAYMHWREGHQEFRPKNEDHLRYFLTVEAGHFDVMKTIRCETVDPDKLYAIVKALLQHAEDNKLFIELDGNLLIEKRARSFAFDAMDHETANKLCNDVSEVIEAKLGIGADALLRETSEAA